MDHIIFWSGAGFFSTYVISDILFYHHIYKATPFITPLTIAGLVCGFIRGYTGKSIYEVIICT